MALVSLTKENGLGLQAFLSEFDAADEGIPAYFAPRDWKIDQIIAQHQREERWCEMDRVVVVAYAD